MKSVRVTPFRICSTESILTRTGEHSFKLANDWPGIPAHVITAYLCYVSCIIFKGSLIHCLKRQILASGGSQGC